MGSNGPNTFILRELKSERRNTLITVSVLGCIIIAFFFSYAAFSKEVKHDTSLISVHLLFRHGDRTPSFIFPSDPNIDSWLHNEGVLTNKGKYQLFLLGKLIRSIYSGFLPDLYNSEQVVVKSSYAERCQMSAATFLAGLYPPIGSQIWNKDLLWQPIPVNPIPRDRDNLIVGKANCPAYTEEKEKSDEELDKELTSEQRKVFDYASENSGINISDISTVESLYYTLKIEVENKLPLPHWVHQIFPEPLRSMALIYLSSFTRTEKLKRLQSGPLLKEWLSNIAQAKIQKSPLLHLYSGHDITIIHTMRSLGLIQNVTWIPQYGASLILEFRKELHHDTLNFFVKFLYLESSSSEKPTELKLTNCDVNCPLEEFEALIKPLIPEDWERECKDL